MSPTPTSKGWVLYEFNRAIARINLDQGFRQDKESSAEAKNQILADLKAAANAPDLNDLIAEEATIHKWLTLNKVKWAG